MPAHRGFSAWIMCGEEILTEYLIAVNEKDHHVQCWIPSQPGKRFAVYWCDHGSGSDTCSFINLDGFVVSGRFLHGRGVASREGIRTGTSTERPFMFQEVVEADTEGVPKRGAKDLGIIQIRIKRVHLLEPRRANPLQAIPPARGSFEGGTCVGFAEERQTFEQEPNTWAVELRDKKPSTWVTFTFRYRTKEFLVAQGIASAWEPAKPPRKSKASNRSNGSTHEEFIPTAPTFPLSLMSPALSLATPSPSPPQMYQPPAFAHMPPTIPQMPSPTLLPSPGIAHLPSPTIAHLPSPIIPHQAVNDAQWGSSATWNQVQHVSPDEIEGYIP